MKEYQLDIFGREKSVKLVQKEIECAKKYDRKYLTDKKRYLESRGIKCVSKKK